jgi:nucleotide-binding universal stress UspA family protein
VTVEGSAAVVVGVDGSDSSLRAVDVAVRMAARSGGSVRIVHAFVWPLMRIPPNLVPAPPVPAGEEAAGGLQQDAERTVEQAQRRAQRVDATVPTVGDVVVGGPAAVLVHQSEQAHLLVLGDRGLGGFAGLLLGSVAEQVSAHAHCPVMIVRGEDRTTGPVIVGVDGSPSSAAAVSFAAAEAVRRGVSLLLAHAWTLPMAISLAGMVPMAYDVDEFQRAAREVLDQAAADVRRSHPRLPVDPRLLEGPAPAMLIDLSREGQLVVTGTRGRGGFTGLLLGSVSQAVLNRADCPVVVVRTTDPR